MEKIRDHTITIPDFIKNKLLLEVTGLKQFSIRNLSNPVKK